MISDNINENWLIRVDELANQLELGQIDINRFTDDQLTYLIYWNFGVSGAYVMRETKLAEEELIRRNNPYDSDYAELLEAETSKYY
jgi:hypothetical protein